MISDDVVGKCWHCGHDLTRADFGREADCPGCRKPTRVCRNCRMYAPGRPNDCFEPMAEAVQDKTKANFCEHFEPTDRAVEGKPTNDRDALLKAAEALFKT